MRSSLSDYGWSGADSVIVLTNSIKFFKEGILVNNTTKMKSSQLPAIQGDFTYKSVDTGLVLWYNTIGYIVYKITSNNLSIVRIYDGKEIVIRNSFFSDLEVTAPAVDSTFTLRAEMNGTNLKCYYNGTLIFNVEQNTFKEGAFGIYGAIGAICNSFSAESNAINNWVRSWATTDETGCTTIDNGVVTITKSSPSGSAGIYSTLTTIIGQTYTVSINYIGNLSLSVTEGATTLASTTASSQTEAVASLSFVPTTTSPRININLADGTSLVIKEPQVEQKPFKTSFVSSLREASLFSMPSNNMNRYAGGISMWISPKYTYSTGTLPIFYYNDLFKMQYSAGSFALTYGDAVLSIPFTLAVNGKYHVICTWNNGDQLNVDIYDGVNDTTNTLSIASKTFSESDCVYIGCTPTISGNVVIDTIVVYSGQISIATMKGFRSEPTTEDDNRIVISSDFTNECIIYSSNKVIVPVGKSLTPIIVEDESGTIYERVYFTDNSKYTIHNKKVFDYTGSNTFTLDYDNLISVRAYSNTKIYDNVNVSGNIVTINDITEDDVTITNEKMTQVTNKIFMIDRNNVFKNTITIKEFDGNVTYTDIDANSYRIDNNGLIIFSNAPENTIVASYKYSPTEKITIEYTPKYVFCADYNDEAGGQEITFSNVSGKAITITFENDTDDGKLVTTVEANPFKSANNNGFIYVTQTAIQATTLDVKVTPDALLADGNQVATIIIDCIGQNGVPTSNVSLDVSLANGSKYGFIEKYVTDEEQAWITAFEAEKALNGEAAAIAKYGNLITDEHMSGRYIYKFHVNNITTGESFTEKIIVTDTKSQIGTEMPIRIVSK
jgi:hypothetical protein